MDVGALLTGNARVFPNKPALIIGDHVLTYAELNRRVNRLANGLAALGIGHGDPVVIDLKNGHPWVETYYAASKLGAPLVPVNTRSKGQELAHVLRSSGSKAIVYSAGLEPELAGTRSGQVLIRVDDDAAERVLPSHDYEALLAASSDAEPDVEPARSDPQTICYTSGTTGLPKGAVLSQDNLLLSQFYLLVTQYQLRSDDVFLVPGALSHRTGWGRVVQSISMGATVEVITRFKPEALLESISKNRITALGFVPTMLRLVMNVPDRSQYDLSSVRVVFLTGEGTPPSLKEEILGLFPGAQLWTSLATTECGTIAIHRPEDQLRRPLAAGRLIPGIKVRLVDDDGRDVPPGQDGEIWVNAGERGTFTIMLGYLGGEAINNQVFTGRWYHTGDVGRFDEDGYLYLTDRKKDMIISGGINIYSKEVENAVLMHPAVEECAVVGVPDRTWGERVKAFVVLKPGARAAAEEIIAACAAHVASHKKPKEIEFTDSLPRNVAGKVLKTLLRARAVQAPGTTT